MIYRKAQQSKLSRQLLILAARAAYRRAREPRSEKAAQSAIREVAHQANRLSRFASGRQKKRFGQIRRHLDDGELHLAADVLAELGYEPAAEDLRRVWACRCGSTLDSLDDLHEHIAGAINSHHTRHARVVTA